MADNIPKTEYEQKQKQNYLIERTRERRSAEAELGQEEEMSEDYQDELSPRPTGQNIQTEIEHKQRIKWWMGWALILTALCVDLLELLLVDTGLDLIAFGSFGTILSIGASFGFWVWFLNLGVTYSSNTKRYVATLITNIGEIIPGLDILQIWFLWTIGMWIIVGMVRMEDKGKEPSIIGAFWEMFSIGSPIGFVVTKTVGGVGSVARKITGGNTNKKPINTV